MQFYANALRDALRKVNSRRRDALEGLNAADWRALIYRELQSDNWYEQPTQDVMSIVEVIEAPSRPLAVSLNGNGIHPIPNEM